MRRGKGKGNNQALLRFGGFPPRSTSSGTERKFIDVRETTYGINLTSGVGTLLNGIAPGTDFTQRVGRRTCCTSIHFRGHIEMGTGDFSDIVRILIVYDAQTNTTLPNLTTILGAGAEVTKFNDISQNRRFLILKDWYLALNKQYSAQTPEFKLKLNKKMCLLTNYSGTDGLIGSIADGSIALYAIGTKNAGATAPTMLFTSRIRFRDN